MSSPMAATTNEESGHTRQTLKQRAKEKLNFPFFVTILFFLKVALILMLTAGAISVSVIYAHFGESRYYNFVAVTGIAVALLLILINFCNIPEKFPKIPWNLIEILFNFLWAILILVASAIVTDKARTHAKMDSYAAGAFFGYASLLIYLIDALIRTIKMKRGEIGFTIRRANPESTYDASKNNSQPTY